MYLEDVVPSIELIFFLQTSGFSLTGDSDDQIIRSGLTTTSVGPRSQWTAPINCLGNQGLSNGEVAIPDNLLGGINHRKTV